MRIGLQIGFIGTPGQTSGEYLASVAEQADQAGFSTLVLPDHFSLRPETTPFIRMTEGDSAPEVVDFLEAWSVLAFVAARTKQIKLSTMVSGITMRYPAVLIKTADTLDSLSNGRAYLGLGASPDFGADEHQRMGLPFPPAGERVARLEEIIQLAFQLWSGEDRPFEGKYYHLASTLGRPLFIHKPHPPILIAGQGNRMLRIMARYADAVSIGFGRDLEDLRAKLELLRKHCQEFNRPYEEIAKTTLLMAPFVQDKRLNPAVLETLAQLASLGIDEVMIRYPGNPADFELLATELLPAVEKMEVAGR